METVDSGQEQGRPQTDPPSLRKPYLTAGGTLVIPFDSDPKYHWWKEGQSVAVTLDELRAGVANQGRDESQWYGSGSKV